MLSNVASINYSVIKPILPAVIAASAGLGWWLFDAGLMMYWYDVAPRTALLPDGEPAARRFVEAVVVAGAALFGSLARSYGNSANPGREAGASLPSRLLLESTFDCVLTVNADLEITAANEAANRMFGNVVCNPPMPIERFVPRLLDSALTSVSSIRELLQRSDVWTYRTISVDIARADGRCCTAEVRIIPAPGDLAEGFVMFIRERRDEGVTNQALRRTREKYRELFEQLPDGMFSGRLDGTILTANPAFVQMLGYASEDDLSENVNAHDLFLYPEQRDLLLDQLELDGHARDYEIDLRRKDLTEITVKANVMLAPGGPGGEPVYQGIFADITDLRDTTNALRDSEEHFRALADNTPDLVIVFDEQARLVYCSPASERVLGYQPFELNGKCAFEHVDPDDVDTLTKTLNSVFAEPGSRSTLTFRVRNRDGNAVYVETVATAFVDSKDEKRGVATIRDVSDRREQELQLQQAQKLQAIGQLTGGVAHDFNNLLTVIVGCLQLIDSDTHEASLQNQLDLAMRAAMRGSDLTRQLLAFARCQPLRPCKIDPGKLFDRMEPALRNALGPKMKIEVDCPNEVWNLRADPEQLERSLLNLAQNAREACNGRGTFSISVRNSNECPQDLVDVGCDEASEYVALSVSDDGRGMAEDVRARAVEPFFTTKTDSSSGLGLSMAYGFVRQTAGFLRIENNAGPGTTIRLLIPREPANEADTPTSHRKDDSPRGGERVLVVEDDDAVRASAVELVADLGYEVSNAEDADAAMRVLEQSGADLLFSDVRMPGKSGFELAIAVRNRYPNTRILLTSGFTDKPTLPHGGHLDGFDFIPKPYRKHNLAERIRAVLDEPQ